MQTIDRSTDEQHTDAGRASVAVPTARPSHSAPDGYPASGHQFDWLVAILSGWLMGGVHLDGWAHNHFPRLETFFTPWHAALYSGFLALFLTLLFWYARNLGRGYAWRRALPAGYGLSLIGGCVFLAGGVLDMLWHIAFGIEANTEALLSPTHLMLGTGGVLLVGGPLRAAWQRHTGASLTLARALPALLSLTYMLAALAFFTQFAHPQVDLYATQHVAGPQPHGNSSISRSAGIAPTPTAGTSAPRNADAARTLAGAPAVIGTGSVWQGVDLGVASILLQAALLTGTALVLVRRWPELPFGGFIILFGIASLLISFMRDRQVFIPAAILTGLLADLLFRWLRPAPVRPTALRVFAFSVPAVYYALYFATLALVAGIGWTVHLWLGAIFMAGVAGLLLSFLLLPGTLDGVRSGTCYAADALPHASEEG